MVQDLFVNPATVINRSATADAIKLLNNDVSQEHILSAGCQCVSCRQCDNKCNK